MNDHDRRGFYRILEANPNTTTADIKRNYRRLALEHHPDVAPDEDRRGRQHHRMSEINEAYETLRDPDRRSIYDRECSFPRCRVHPQTFISGRCPRCREIVCPECCLVGSTFCRACGERRDRMMRTKDPVERALLALEDGDLDIARKALERALLANPRDVVALTALSTLREKLGDYGAAAMALRLALDIKPGHAFSHFRLGSLHQRMGDAEEALSCYEEALRLSPGNPKFRGAISMLRETQCSPDSPRFFPNDQVSHRVFGSGVVTEVTPVGVKVAFGDGSARWLDPNRSPMVRSSP